MVILTHMRHYRRDPFGMVIVRISIPFPEFNNVQQHLPFQLLVNRNKAHFSPGSLHDRLTPEPFSAGLLVDNHILPKVTLVHWHAHSFLSNPYKWLVLLLWFITTPSCWPTKTIIFGYTRCPTPIRWTYFFQQLLRSSSSRFGKYLKPLGRVILSPFYICSNRFIWPIIVESTPKTRYLLVSLHYSEAF